MSSYLSIYLERKKKEGEEKGERLLLTSISRADDLYGIFYDNITGISREDNYHEFTVEDLDHLISEIGTQIETQRISIERLQQVLPYLRDKDAIADTVELITSEQEYKADLAKEKTKIDAICTFFADIGKEWCDFYKLYWKID